MPREKWETQTKAGYSHDILLQGEEADCGVCCCAMVINLMKGGRPTSKAVQQVMPRGAYAKATTDRAGLTPTLLTAVVGSPPVDAGTLISGISGALAKYNISNTPYGAGSLQNALSTATRGKPVIVQVRWEVGGYHWVVIARSLGAAQFVLDPAYGLQFNHSLDKYAGVEETGGRVVRTIYGTWQKEWLKVD